MSDHPAITDADRDCARLIIEYVASVTDPRGMIERQLQIFREREVHLALEAERQRDNRVYRAIKELLHASTPADRANLAAGLLVALDRLAEKASVSEQAPDHIADAGKMVAIPRLLAPGETPTPGFYWATLHFPVTNDRQRMIFEYRKRKWYSTERTWQPCDPYRLSDFYGPLTDPRAGGQT